MGLSADQSTVQGRSQPIDQSQPIDWSTMVGWSINQPYMFDHDPSTHYPGLVTAEGENLGNSEAAEQCFAIQVGGEFTMFCQAGELWLYRHMSY